MAARNMLRCVLAMAEGKPRPVVLQRQGQQLADPAQAALAAEVADLEGDWVQEPKCPPD